MYRLVQLAMLSSLATCMALCPDSCSLLGECKDNKCICDPGFKGDNCGVVDLLPATRGGGFVNKTLSSWGGKVIKLDDTYHMFASAMANNCTLAQFSTNSMSIHATASSPSGPFAFQRTVLPPFHHSTTAVADNKGGLLLFTIGKDTHGVNLHTCNGSTPQPLGPNCTADMAALGCVEGGGKACSQCVSDNRKFLQQAGACWSSPCPSHKCYFDFVKRWCGEQVGLRPPLGPHDYMSITRAPGVDGPFSERVIFTTDTDPDKQSAWNCNKSNPSPVVLSNGTILLMYRGQRCKRDPGCRTATLNTCEHQGIAVAMDADSPFEDRQGEIKELAGNEDAFFWKGRRGFHAIFHSKNACGQLTRDVNVCGSLAWSEDSWTWHLNEAPTYNGTVEWDDGQTETLLSRQRPKILFAPDGVTPLYLYNGAQSDGQDGMPGRQYTLAVPFNTNTRKYT